jgi:hypothetical protein
MDKLGLLVKQLNKELEKLKTEISSMKKPAGKARK